MLGVHGPGELDPRPNIDRLPPEWFISLGWVADDKAFVALAGSSCECLRLCGGYGVLVEYRYYNEERIAHKRAQAERNAIPSSPEEVHTE